MCERGRRDSFSKYYSPDTDQQPTQPPSVPAAHICRRITGQIDWCHGVSYYSIVSSIKAAYTKSSHQLTKESYTSLVVVG